MIAVLIGTRPELIKMAPVLRKFKEEKMPYIFIHSGQHYTEEMDSIIMKDLGLGEPDYNLLVGSGSHAVQTGKIMERVEEIFKSVKPDVVLVHGDTNTTLAGALTAKKLQIPVGHVEAGLRSFDYKMPEEINRILTDRITDYLFAPTPLAKDNLLKEGIDGKNIVVTGNTVVDALNDHLPMAKKSKILNKLKIKGNDFILLTAHRPENVDDKEKLESLIEVVIHVSRKLNKRVIWPIHPRTEKQLELFKIKLPEEFTTLPPAGYLDMLMLISSASLVLTDSGGIQEEAYILKKQLITLRDSTERPETLTANFIVGLDKEKVDKALEKYKGDKVKWTNSFGNGKAALLITNYLKEVLNK